MGVVGTGSAKLILFGEHAAVHGHPAVGMQLPEQITVTIDGPFRGSWDLGAVGSAEQEAVRRLVERLEQIVPGLASSGRGSVRIRSDVPRGVGMGSSAALCVAAVRAALQHAGRAVADAGHAVADAGHAPTGGPDPRLVWETAHELERMFHGTPSGIDTGLSLFPGVSAFLPAPPGLPRMETIHCDPVMLVVAAAPRSRDTGALVRAVSERLSGGDPRTRSALQALGDLARQCRDSLALRTPAEGAGAPGATELQLPPSAPARTAIALGDLADQAMEHLRALGLGSPDLDLLLEEGKRAGALGGKLSGAGGGGAFYLVAPDPEAAKEISARVSAAALRAGISLASPCRIIETSSPP